MLSLIGIDALGALTMVPAELTTLDRALTVEEQRAVEEWQGEQADTTLAKERKSVYVDPRTGARRNAIVADVRDSLKKLGTILDPYATKAMAITKKPIGGVPAWKVAATIAVVGVAGYFALRSSRGYLSGSWAYRG